MGTLNKKKKEKSLANPRHPFVLHHNLSPQCMTFNLMGTLFSLPRCGVFIVVGDGA